MENPTGCEKLPRMDMDESCEYTISIHICKLVFLQHPSTKLHICTRELKYNGKIHFLDCGSNFLGASYTFFCGFGNSENGNIDFQTKSRSTPLEVLKLSQTLSGES